MAKRKQPTKRSAAQAANSRRRRRKRTGRRTLHYILLVVFLLAAGAVLSLTTFFKIESVYVVGTDKYPPEELVEASGIQVGENLFRVSVGGVEEILTENYPYVEGVRIHRKLPPAIEIQVTQAEPAAAIMEGDQVVLLTREGKVLERGKILIPPGVPAVQGLDTTGIAPGESLGEDYRGALIMLDYLFEAVEETGFHNITNVDITNPYNMMVIYENRLLLKLGTEADLKYKLEFILEAMEHDVIGPDAEGRVDVSNAGANRKLNYKKVSLREALELERKSGGGAPDMPSAPQEDDAEITDISDDDENSTS